MADTEKNLENSILSDFSPQIRERIQPALKRVRLPLGQVLHETGEVIDYVYFPVDCIVSLLSVLEDGATAEVSIIGNEGMAGLPVFLGVDSTPVRSVVQRGGEAYRLPSAVLKNAFQHGWDTNLMLGYTQSLMIQMSQTAVCNRHHSIEKRLCRWLLLSLDRLPGDEVSMTQELIANMLGVRREGVTEAASRLQRLGVIEYHRGHIRVLDRGMLKRLSCECYQVLRRETERLQKHVTEQRRKAKAAPVTDASCKKTTGRT